MRPRTSGSIHARDAYLHAIEVQDLSCYALVIDVRSREEYEDDHTPGAVRLKLSPSNIERQQTLLGDPAAHADVRPGEGPGDLPEALGEVVKPVRWDAAIRLVSAATIGGANQNKAAGRHVGAVAYDDDEHQAAAVDASPTSSTGSEGGFARIERPVAIAELYGSFASPDGRTSDARCSLLALRGSPGLSL